MKRSLSALLVVIVLMSIVGCGSSKGWDGTLDKLESGMKEDQVVQLLGQPKSREDSYFILLKYGEKELFGHKLDFYVQLNKKDSANLLMVYVFQYSGTENECRALFQDLSTKLKSELGNYVSENGDSTFNTDDSYYIEWKYKQTLGIQEIQSGSNVSYRVAYGKLYT